MVDVKAEHVKIMGVTAVFIVDVVGIDVIAPNTAIVEVVGVGILGP